MSILLLSGGVDSLVLLAKQNAAGQPPYACVSFDYGQRHAVKEMTAAESIAYYLRVVRWIRVKLPTLVGSTLTGESGELTGAPTVVPNRNAILLSYAAALAVQHDQSSVLFAAHAGDAEVYPDCRAAFVAALGCALELGCGVGIEAPFLTITKRDIVRLGETLHVPFHLTWSCYTGGAEPCGNCGACASRKAAGL